jgi:nucleoid-associated protein YgaU
VVQPGDTLWQIAERHYGNALRYPAIKRANRAVRRTNFIVPCQRLYLPR